MFKVKSPYSLCDLPYVLCGDVTKVKSAVFRDVVYEHLRSGWQCCLIYELNKSVFVRLVKMGKDGFVKADKVLRTFPMSSKAAYRLLVRL